MGDIVEQLRSGLDNADGDEMGGVVLTMREAADEIERLRHALTLAEIGIESGSHNAQIAHDD